MGNKGISLPGVRGHSTAVDYDAQENKPRDSRDLDRTQYELDFAIAPDTKDVDDSDEYKEARNPDTDIVTSRRVPVRVLGPKADC